MRIVLLILLSTIFCLNKIQNKKINFSKNISKVVLNQEVDRENRIIEEIINVDFEGDLSGWSQDNSDGWELTTESYSSPTHSYNSPDNNNSGELTTHSLYSEQVELPSLVDGEIIQYSFALNCDMPDFSQEDNRFTPGVDESL